MWENVVHKKEEEQDIGDDDDDEVSQLVCISVDVWPVLFKIRNM